MSSIDRICEKCGVKANRIVRGMCSKCYQREKNIESLPTYQLPQKGEVVYTSEGKIVCHICGKAFTRLLTHVRQYHGISEKDYKKEYGLILYKGIISESSREKSRKAVFNNYDKVVLDNLVKNGKNTRFKDGYKGRTKDKVSLQEMKRLKQNRIIRN